MFSIEFTKQYLKDLKLARKRNLDENKLNDIIQKLINDEPLPEKNKDHALKGDYTGFRECHITPDWLLIYNKNSVIQIVTLVRTGSHSDLF
jgi:mRNA interferase YafQ